MRETRSRGRVPSRITLSVLSRLIEPSSSFVRLRVKIPRCRCDHEMWMIYHDPFAILYRSYLFITPYGWISIFLPTESTESITNIFWRLREILFYIKIESWCSRSNFFLFFPPPPPPPLKRRPTTLRNFIKISALLCHQNFLFYDIKTLSPSTFPSL